MVTSGSLTPGLKEGPFFHRREPPCIGKAHGHHPAAPLAPDEKNGIPSSPQRAALTLELDPEKEPELEPEEPQKPGKPSVFIVFRKVWLGCNPPPFLGERGSRRFSPEAQRGTGRPRRQGQRGAGGTAEPAPVPCSWARRRRERG